MFVLVEHISVCISGEFICISVYVSIYMFADMCVCMYICVYVYTGI